jgi:glyoxylase-like metal-dependent hydrolase (beta-lactamase superfamily II)
VARRIAEDLWLLESKVSMLGMYLPCRMAIVKLAEGGLWLHSPTKLDEAARAALEEIGGPVVWRVAPNLFHHVFQGDYQAAFPESRLIAPLGLAKKRPDLKIDAVFEKSGPAPFGPEIECYPVPGTPGRERVFLHKPSRSLIVTDLAFATDGSFSAFGRLYGRLTGIDGRLGVPIHLRLLYRKRAAMAKALDALLELDFRRIVPAHGPVIEEQPKEALAKAFAFLR